LAWKFIGDSVFFLPSAAVFLRPLDHLTRVERRPSRGRDLVGPVPEHHGAVGYVVGQKCSAFSNHFNPLPQQVIAPRQQVSFLPHVLELIFIHNPIQFFQVT
jgi:hypothetical protein